MSTLGALCRYNVLVFYTSKVFLGQTYSISCKTCRFGNPGVFVSLRHQHILLWQHVCPNICLDVVCCLQSWTNIFSSVFADLLGRMEACSGDALPQARAAMSACSSSCLARAATNFSELSVHVHSPSALSALSSWRIPSWRRK